MSQNPRQWTIERTIPSELVAGRQVLDELLTRLQAERWTSRDLFGIRLALEEAVVNAIKHGNRLDRNKQVHGICKSTLEKIWVKITDQGEASNLKTCRIAQIRRISMPPTDGESC